MREIYAFSSRPSSMPPPPPPLPPPLPSIAAATPTTQLLGVRAPKHPLPDIRLQPLCATKVSQDLHLSLPSNNASPMGN